MPLKVQLTVVDGPDKGQSFEFSEGQMTIGRGRGELPLHDKKISGKHCQIEIIDTHVYLEDLNSTNGTYVAGHKVESKVRLQNLDEIILGLSKLSVAIVEQMGEFKNKNRSNSAPSPMTGELDGMLEEVLTVKKKIKSPEARPQARVEKVPAEQTPHHEKSAKSKTQQLNDIPLPPKDSTYRETGIRRIENLIEDEINTFSKWDDPAIENPEEASAGIPKILVKLMLRKGPEGMSEFVCTKEISTLGRKDVDFRVNDLDCSRKHSAVEIVAGNKVYLRDLGSTNGSYVNGKKVTYQELKAGDMIQIGQSIFEVMIEGDRA